MIERIIAASVHNRVFVLLLAAMARRRSASGRPRRFRSTPSPTCPTCRSSCPPTTQGQAPAGGRGPGHLPAVHGDAVGALCRGGAGLLASSASRLVYVIFEDGTDLYWARSRVLRSTSTWCRAPGCPTPPCRHSSGPDASWRRLGIRVHADRLQLREPEVLRAKLDDDGDGEVTVSDGRAAQRPMMAAAPPVGQPACAVYEVPQSQLDRGCSTVDHDVAGAAPTEFLEELRCTSLCPPSTGTVDGCISHGRAGATPRTSAVSSLAELRSVQDWYPALPTSPGISGVSRGCQRRRLRAPVPGRGGPGEACGPTACR